MGCSRFPLFVFVHFVLVTSLCVWCTDQSYADQSEAAPLAADHPFPDLEALAVPMNPVQAAEVAIQNVEIGQRAVEGKPLENSCDGPRYTVSRGGKPTEIAACFLTDEEWKKIESEAKVAGSGLVKPSKCKVRKFGAKTGNDAKMWKARRYKDESSPGFNYGESQRLSDDQGRTFDVAFQTTCENDEGFETYSLESNNFGRRVPGWNGYQDTDHHPYYKLLSIVDLKYERGEKLRSSQSGSMTVTEFRLVEATLRHQDGSGRTALGGKLQSWFHSKSQSGPTYHYVDADKEKLSALIKVGYQRLIEGDVGAFKCMASATGLVGIDSDGKPLADGSVKVGATTGSLGGRSEQNPWLAMDLMYKQQIVRGSVPTREMTLKTSTSVEIGKKTLKPFIGVSKFDGPLDRRYGDGTRGGRSETIYSFGLLMEVE